LQRLEGQRGANERLRTNDLRPWRGGFIQVSIKAEVGHRRSAAVNVSFRRAVMDDAGVLARLRWEGADVERTPGRQTGVEFEARFGEFVRTAVEGEEWVIWVAEREGRVIGQAYLAVLGMVPRPSRFARKWGYVSGLYVEPEERSKGVGSGLVRRAIEWAKDEGLEFLLLSAEEGSVALYERAGFTRSADLLELALRS
jgi:GNAT superfamily N-acetyltransferase